MSRSTEPRRSPIARSRFYQYKPAGSTKPKQDWPYDPTYDLGRIKRQQYFLRTLAQEAINHGGRNPLVAKRLLEKTVPHLTHDSTMGLSDFLSLVNAFRSVDPAVVQMTTIPTKRQIMSGQDAQVVIDDEAAPMWARLQNFASSTKPAPPPNIPPAQIRVQVLNGSGVKGVAGTTATALTAHGFASGGAAADADRHTYTTTEVRYAPGAQDKARVVMAYLGGAGTLVALASAPAGADVVVVVGHDFSAVSAPGAPTTTAAPTSTASPNPGSTPGVTVPKTADGLPLVGCG